MDGNLRLNANGASIRIKRLEDDSMQFVVNDGEPVLACEKSGEVLHIGSADIIAPWVRLFRPDDEVVLENQDGNLLTGSAA